MTATAPSTGPWDRNQGFIHMNKAQRHCHMTLIKWNGLPLREKPLALSHHCKDLMYSRPKGMTFDIAAIRPTSLWNYFLQWATGPSMILFTAARIELIWARDKRAYIDMNPIPLQDECSSELEKGHSFWCLALTPVLSYEQGWHLERPNHHMPFEAESTNRQYSLESGCLAK